MMEKQSTLSEEGNYMQNQSQFEGINVRQLNNDMFDAFVNKDGKYYELLQIVKRDKTLDLEFRGDYASIYYRGGQLFKITKDKLEFNSDYTKWYPECEIDIIPSPTLSYAIKYFPFYKQAMNYKIDSKRGQIEREFAQLVVRDNNYVKDDMANDSDFFIADYEYKISTKDINAEVDMVAIKWPTTQRKQPDSVRIALIEMKFGNKSVVGNAGLKKHLDDYQQFLSHKDIRESFCKDMVEVFKQKCKLGICKIDDKNENNNSEREYRINKIAIKNFEVEVIFLLANYQPQSNILYSELNNINFAKYNFPIRFASSSMMGYCLYDREDMMWTPERCKNFAVKYSKPM